MRCGRVRITRGWPFAVRGFALLAWVVVAVSPVSAVEPVPSGDRIQDLSKGISIALPAGWEKKEGYQEASLVGLSPLSGSGDTFRENLNLIVVDLPQPMALATYFDLNITGIKSGLKDYTEYAKGPAVLGGKEARYVVYGHAMRDVTLKVLQYYVVHGNRGYVLTYTAPLAEFDAYRLLFEQNAATLEIR